MLTIEDFVEVYTDGIFTGFACTVFDDLCVMEDSGGYMYWYTQNSQGAWRLLGNSGYDYFFTLPQGLTILERLAKEYNLEFNV